MALKLHTHRLTQQSHTSVHACINIYETDTGSHVHIKWAPPLHSYPHHSESLTAHHGRVMYIFTACRMDQSRKNAAPSAEAVKLNYFKQCRFHTADRFLNCRYCTFAGHFFFLQIDLQTLSCIKLYLSTKMCKLQKTTWSSHLCLSFTDNLFQKEKLYSKWFSPLFYALKMCCFLM